MKVQKLLNEMDVSAPQVTLSTVIGELRLNNDETYGFDYFLRGGQAALVSRNGGAVFLSADASPAGVNPLNLFNPGNILNFSQIATAAATGGANVYVAAGNSFSPTTDCRVSIINT